MIKMLAFRVFLIVLIWFSMYSCSDCPKRYTIAPYHGFIEEVKPLMSFKDLSEVRFRNELGEVKVFELTTHFDTEIEQFFKNLQCDDFSSFTKGVHEVEYFLQTWTTLEGDTIRYEFTSDADYNLSSIQDVEREGVKPRNIVFFTVKFAECDEFSSWKWLENDEGESLVFPGNSSFTAYNNTYTDIWWSRGRSVRMSRTRGIVTVETCNGRWAQILD